MYSGPLGSIVMYPATPNSEFSSRVNSSEAGSWTIQEDLVDGTSFRRFNPSVRQIANRFPAEGSSYDGTGYSVLDIWEIRPGTSGEAGTWVGAIGLNNAGKLVFSNVANAFAPAATTPVELGSPSIVRAADGRVTVTLQGSGGSSLPAGNYILQRSTSLEAGSWQDLATQSPVSGSLTYLDAEAPSPRAFYRIKKAS